MARYIPIVQAGSLVKFKREKSIKKTVARLISERIERVSVDLCAERTMQNYVADYSRVKHCIEGDWYVFQYDVPLETITFWIKGKSRTIPRHHHIRGMMLEIWQQRAEAMSTDVKYSSLMQCAEHFNRISIISLSVKRMANKYLFFYG